MKYLRLIVIVFLGLSITIQPALGLQVPSVNLTQKNNSQEHIIEEVGGNQFPRNHKKHSIAVGVVVFVAAYSYALNQGGNGQERIAFASLCGGGSYLMYYYWGLPPI